MNITIEKTENTTTVYLNGRIDTAAADESAPYFTQLEKETGGTIVFECQNLEFVCSSLLRHILVLRKSAGEKGGRIIARNISKNIREVFSLTGFLSILEIE